MQPKVFGIGLNKTGTTTLKAALQMMGYRVTGPNKRALSDVLKGRNERALAMAEQFDAVQDWPFPLVLEPLFARYGTGARYILTVRKSPETWLRSIKNHHLQERMERTVFRWNVYGPPSPFGFEVDYLRYYETHNERVRAFFRQHNAEHVLLEVCWEHGDGWSELCNFLQREAPDAPFPHANATAERSWRRYRQVTHGIAAHISARLNGRRVTDRVFDGPL